MNGFNFTAATFNMWDEHYKAGGGIVHFPDRHDQIGTLLGNQFDLIAIQEISQQAFDSIGKKLKGYWRAFQPHPNRPDGVAIFAKTKVFDWRKTQILDIPGGDNKSGLLIEIEHKAAKKTVAIATSHFKGGPLPDRLKGDLECDTVARALTQANGNLKILAGDFNQGSKDQQNNRVSQVKERYGFQEETQNEYDTEPCNRRRIDYLLYKTEHETEVAVNTAPPQIVDIFLQARVSDHVPYVQEFEFIGIAPPENLYMQLEVPHVAEAPLEPIAHPPIDDGYGFAPEPFIEPSGLNLQPIGQDHLIPDANRVQMQPPSTQDRSGSSKTSWTDWFYSLWDGVVSFVVGIFRSCGFVS